MKLKYRIILNTCEKNRLYYILNFFLKKSHHLIFIQLKKTCEAQLIATLHT
jgi:hypothetical protein